MIVQILFRPESGRLICGVAAGFAERFSIPVWIIRCFLVAALIVSPLTALWYLLFAVSIPPESKILSQLKFQPKDSSRNPGTRFEQFATILSNRFVKNKSGRPNSIAIALLLFAGLLELPQIEGVNFYASHPYLSIIVSSISGFGQPLFYFSLATVLLLVSRGKVSPTGYYLPRKYSFSLDHTSQKMIGGIVSGAAPVLGIDPAYLRAAIILLNFLTLGLAGAAYLAVWYFVRRKSLEPTPTPDAEPIMTHSDHLTFRLWAAISLFLLGEISISSHYRLYFFNISLIHSLVLIGSGFLIVWIFLRKQETGNEIWTLSGAVVFLSGIYLLAINVAHIQFTIPAYLEIAEIILALSFGYLAITSLVNYARTLGFIFALAFLVSAVLISINIVPPRYLSELVRFYTFFYPVIFAGIGLWVAFEK